MRKITEDEFDERFNRFWKLLMFIVAFVSILAIAVVIASVIGMFQLGVYLAEFLKII